MDMKTLLKMGALKKEDKKNQQRKVGKLWGYKHQRQSLKLGSGWKRGEEGSGTQIKKM